MLLLAVFAVMFLTNLGLRELRSQEALLATIALEMRGPSGWLRTTAHGENVEAFPLNAWLVNAASLFRRPNEWTSRLPAACAVLGLAALCGLVARQFGGPLAGCVAAAMALSTLVSLREGVRAGSDTMFALLLAGAWFAWYIIGRERRQWALAWPAALALVFMATLAGGLVALPVFYVPLFFLRRPLLAYRRMLLPAHLLAVAVFIVAIIVWRVLAPAQVLFPWSTFALVPEQQIATHYLRERLFFPVLAALYLMPWTFLAWPGFCQAYRPLERNPVFCHFLRVLVLPLFVGAWLLPGISPRAMLPLLGPLAVLTGLHFEILVRRHHRQLERLVEVLCRIGIVYGTAAALVGTLHLLGVVVFERLGLASATLGVLFLCLAVGIAHGVVHRGGGRPFWVRLLLTIAALRLAYLATFSPLRSWLDSEHRDHGRALGANVPAEATVFKTTQWFMVTECFYIGRPISRIYDPDTELPTDAAFVHVLGGSRPPAVASRTWAPISPPVALRAQNERDLNWFPGRWCLLRIAPTAALPVPPPGRNGQPDVSVQGAAPAPAAPVVVRMYCGARRP